MNYEKLKSRRKIATARLKELTDYKWRFAV